jgi:glycosyltransferase involved in cell wall biosynthesis
VQILWLKTELLHPVDKGGKIRSYYMLRELRRDHHITYLTLDDGSAGADARKRATEYCHELVCIPHSNIEKFSAGFYLELAQNLTSRLPYAIKKYQSTAMLEEIKLRTRSGQFDVAVCDFLAPSINVPNDLPCASVLFQHNVEAVIWKRHFEIQSSPLKKTFLRNQWQKMRAFERKASQRFDGIVAVSRDDRETIRRDYAVDNVYEIPTGVDIEFFRPGNNSAETNGLVFTGSMDWLPNEDAIRYFTDQILPLIRLKIPRVTLTVVGRNPYPSLLELGKRDPAIIVTGRVDDVRPYIERAAAYIVPIRIGGGTRLKIYEAMAMAKPVISTSVGAEGLPLHEGKELLLSDTAEDFAESVVRVLTDNSLARSLGETAATRVREEFGWNKVANVFEMICSGVISGKLPDSRARAI